MILSGPSQGVLHQLSLIRSDLHLTRSPPSSGPRAAANGAGAGGSARGRTGAEQSGGGGVAKKEAGLMNYQWGGADWMDPRIYWGQD